ncbi:cytochrome C oxidase subunit IV family protein [Myxococcota bacterium]|nr:cytochrome C oxidase subunit IV family protein [Myxococcota bacterium]
MSHHKDSHGSHEPHVLPLSIYFGVFFALMILTYITVKVSQLGLGALAIPIAMTVALIKAGFVVGYFMHLRYDDRFLSLFFASSIVFLGVFFAFTVYDLGARDTWVPEEHTQVNLIDGKPFCDPEILKNNDRRKKVCDEAKKRGDHGHGHGAHGNVVKAAAHPTPAKRGVAKVAQPAARPATPAPVARPTTPAPAPVARPTTPAPAPAARPTAPAARPTAPAPAPAARPAAQFDAASLAAGKKLYQANACWTCHGNEGKGDGAAAAALPVKPANFALGNYKYGGSLGDIYKVLSNGSPNKASGMVAYAHIPDNDRWSIAKYLLSLKK